MMSTTTKKPKCDATPLGDEQTFNAASHVIFEFVGGSTWLVYDAITSDRANEQLHINFHLEIVRRQKLGLNTHGTLRPRKSSDVLAAPEAVSVPATTRTQR